MAMTVSTDEGNERMKNLIDRVQRLEVSLSSPVNRVLRDLRQRQIFGYQMIRVPSDYYERPLQARASVLKAASTAQLCKTIVVENKNFYEDENKHELDPTNSRYYCIVIQYEHKLDGEKLKDFVMSLKPKSNRLPRKKFHFHLAPEKVNDGMTGFCHNAVCPFGLITPIPIIICKSCMLVSPSFLWMGGGEVDIKLGLPTHDFVRGTQAAIADISELRPGVEMETEGI